MRSPSIYDSESVFTRHGESWGQHGRIKVWWETDGRRIKAPLRLWLHLPRHGQLLRRDLRLVRSQGLRHRCKGGILRSRLSPQGGVYSGW